MYKTQRDATLLSSMRANGNMQVKVTHPSGMSILVGIDSCAEKRRAGVAPGNG